MRWNLLLLLMLTAIAGCLDGEPTDDEDPMDDDDVPMAQAPEPLHYEGSLFGIGTGLGVEPIYLLAAMQCATHSFTLEATHKVTLTLIGADGVVDGVTSTVLYGADYDLRLLDAAGNVIGESTNPSGEEDAITATLEAGTYEALVEAWHDVDGSYTLDIVFE